MPVQEDSTKPPLPNHIVQLEQAELESSSSKELEIFEGEGTNDAENDEDEQDIVGNRIEKGIMTIQYNTTKIDLTPKEVIGMIFRRRSIKKGFSEYKRALVEISVVVNTPKGEVEINNIKAIRIHAMEKAKS